MIAYSGQKLNGKRSILSPNWDGIPNEIKEKEWWLVWKSEERNGRFTKVPYAAGPRTKARTNDPGTWRLYDAAQFVFENYAGEYDGVGIVIKGEIVGIDIDHCRNPETGELAPLAVEIVKLLDSYTEVSPSGTGVKILCQGQVPGSRHRNGDIGTNPWSQEKIGLEVYDKDSPRFFTITGCHVEGTPAGVESRPEQVKELYERFFRPLEVQEKPKVASSAAPSSELPLEVEQIVAVASEAANGDKFKKLWAGKWEEDYKSQSEADLALVSVLAFYCRNDPELIDNVFRHSGLMRDKWEREDYRERTVNAGLSEECFNWDVVERHRKEMEQGEELDQLVPRPRAEQLADLRRLSPIDFEVLDRGVRTQIEKEKKVTKKEKLTQPQAMIKLAEDGAELWKTPDDVAYATVVVGITGRITPSPRYASGDGLQGDTGIRSGLRRARRPSSRQSKSSNTRHWLGRLMRFTYDWPVWGTRSTGTWRTTAGSASRLRQLAGV